MKEVFSLIVRDSADAAGFRVEVHGEPISHLRTTTKYFVLQLLAALDTIKKQMNEVGVQSHYSDGKQANGDVYLDAFKESTKH